MGFLWLARCFFAYSTDPLRGFFCFALVAILSFSSTFFLFPIMLATGFVAFATLGGSFSFPVVFMGLGFASAGSLARIFCLLVTVLAIGPLLP